MSRYAWFFRPMYPRQDAVYWDGTPSERMPGRRRHMATTPKQPVEQPLAGIIYTDPPEAIQFTICPCCHGMTLASLSACIGCGTNFPHSTQRRWLQGWAHITFAASWVMRGCAAALAHSLSYLRSKGTGTHDQ